MKLVFDEFEIIAYVLNMGAEDFKTTFMIRALLLEIIRD